MSAALLATALSAAVPIWVSELSRKPLVELLAEGPTLAQVIAEKGDAIQFKGKRQGQSGQAFNALAKALAILSFVPGGVRFAGVHFESKHPDSVACETNRH